jgi:S-adenosylmethionine hydrolase
MSVITLTTDFGLQDWFVGTMKGVIATIAPKARVIDLTHDVPPGDVQAAAFALAASCRHFPAGTIHLVIVDPGVGSSRTAIVIETENYRFMAPDNGVLSFALRSEAIKAIHRLENREFAAAEVSRTFHGRDIFSPAAAHVSKGITLRRFGPRVDGFQELKWPAPVEEHGRWWGEVVYIDHFGNAITNLPATLPIFSQKETIKIQLPKNRVRFAVGPFYGSVAKGKALGVLGSIGFLELAVNGGAANRDLRIRIGDKVVVSQIKRLAVAMR